MGRMVIQGGSNINTLGVQPNIIRINLDDNVVIPTGGSLTVTDLTGPGFVRTDNTGLFSVYPDSSTNGQVLISSASGAPAWASLTAGANITITPGANSITISAVGGAGTGITTVHGDAGDAFIDIGDDSVTIVGDGGNITTTGDNVTTLTVSISNSPIFTGTVTAGTGFVATTGNITATTGDVVITAGDLTVTAGTINLSSLTEGVMYLNGANAVTTIPNGTNGQLLIAATGSTPAWANLTSTGGSVTITNGPNSINLEAAGVAAVTALTSDTGDATPSGGKIGVKGGLNINTDNLVANTVTVNLNKSISQPNTNGSGTEGLYSLNSLPFMHNFSSDGSNTFIGSEAGNLTLTTAIGNVGVGQGALNSLTTGNANTVINGAYSLTSGSNNIIIGSDAASTYNGGQSSNIVIGNAGNVADANTIRIGTQGAGAGQQNATYIAGIYQGSTGGTNEIVIVDSTGKLGSSKGTDGQILIGSSSGSPTWGTITAGAGITVTNGAGTITITATGGGGSGATNFPTNSGTAIQSLGVLNILGGENVNTTGAGNTVTVNLNRSIAWPSTAVNPGTPGGYEGLIRINSQFFMHARGTRNTFLGLSAGNLTLTATDVTGIGANSLTSITSGNFNTALGSGSGQALTTSVHNTLLGYNAGASVSTGTGSNILVGSSSGASVTTGSDNIAIGRQSMNTATTSTENVVIGRQAMSAGTGSRNTALGHQALQNTGTSSDNIAVGYQAGINLTGATGGNIYIGNTGTAGDQDFTRIGPNEGTGGAQVGVFMSGIYNRGTIPANTTERPVFAASDGRLLTGPGLSQGQIPIGNSSGGVQYGTITSDDGSIEVSIISNNYNVRARSVKWCAYQTAWTAGAVTGSGETYVLGTQVAFGKIGANGGFDPDNIVNTGGAGNPVSVTIPVTGTYFIECHPTAYYVTPPPPPPTPPPPPPVDPIFIRVNGVNRWIYYSPGLDLISTQYRTAPYCVFGALNAGDVLTFAVQVTLNPTFTGVGFLGLLGLNQGTFISGFLVN